jgi:hypothetical protein
VSILHVLFRQLGFAAMNAVQKVFAFANQQAGSAAIIRVHQKGRL